MPHTPGIDFKFAPQPTAQISRNLLRLIYSPCGSLHSANNVNRSTLCRHLILFLVKVRDTNAIHAYTYINIYMHTLTILLYY